MRQIFKFGRPYDVNKFTLFEPRYYDEIYNIANFPRVSAMESCGSYRTSVYIEETTNPQILMKGIKKFYQKGKYPKPRNF